MELIAEARALEPVARDIESESRQLVITDNALYEKASELLKRIKRALYEIAQLFDPIISQAYRAHKEAVAGKRRLESRFISSERIIKSRMVEYTNRLEAKRQNQERELQRKENRLAKRNGRGPVPVILESDVPQISNVSIREVWKFRIVDANKIPRAYLTPDLAMIGRLVSALKAQAKIPGVEIYPETIVACGRS